MDLSLNSGEPAGLLRDDGFDSMGESFVLPSGFLSGEERVCDRHSGVSCIHIPLALFPGRYYCSYFLEIEEQPGVHS